MRRRRKSISRIRLATTARSLLSTRTSRKSSTGTSTGTSQASRSSGRRESPYGASLSRGYLHGIYTSTKTGQNEYFESSYELRRFRALDASPLVKTWGRSKARIRYKLGKRKRRYHPDIFVVYHDGRVFLEEVKGYVFNKRQFLKKNAMANFYCRAKGWTYRILYEKDLEKVE